MCKINILIYNDMQFIHTTITLNLRTAVLVLSKKKAQLLEKI